MGGALVPAPSLKELHSPRDPATELIREPHFGQGLLAVQVTWDVAEVVVDGK